MILTQVYLSRNIMSFVIVEYEETFIIVSLYNFLLVPFYFFIFAFLVFNQHSLLGLLIWQCQLKYSKHSICNKFVFIKFQDSRFVGSRHENPVNNLTIRKPKFGLVGYTTITIDTLKLKTFRLEKVPNMSPLDGALEMKLSVHSESRVSYLVLLVLRVVN